MSARRLAFGFLLSLLCGWAPVAAALPSLPWRIMPVGETITEGGATAGLTEILLQSRRTVAAVCSHAGMARCERYEWKFPR